MSGQDWIAASFEEHRPHLRAVAFRMLDSRADAEDAVQEAWLRLSGSDANVIDNLGGWLTTVVSRICLNVLRSRAGRETSYGDRLPDQIIGSAEGSGSADPEQEALLADGVGLGLLIVLETPAPAERLAFVLHDVFAISFDEIAAMLDRSPQAARQLASRARRRVRQTAPQPDVGLAAQRDVVDAFFTAARSGDLTRLIRAPPARAGHSRRSMWCRSLDPTRPSNVTGLLSRTRQTNGQGPTCPPSERTEMSEVRQFADTPLDPPARQGR